QRRLARTPAPVAETGRRMETRFRGAGAARSRDHAARTARSCRSAAARRHERPDPRGFRRDAVKGPLAGLRVLELEAPGPVPWAGMMLADMGATVIRIERPAPADMGIPR